MVPALPEGVKVLEQDDVAPVPAKAQALELKVPVPLLLKETAPVGVICAPEPVSVTLAVQVEIEPICKIEGEHVTLVEVLRKIFTELLHKGVPCESKASPPPTMMV